mmetsp:Transcript_1116/g.1369  ORF Transcript_1116/g.1369 Transcript_1116/m.1369 type:complete len:301 (-) Transcript_1116:73-975(-)
MYADQGRALLCSIANKSDFDVLDYAKTLYSIFAGENSLYGDFPEENVSRDQYPVQRGWRPHSIKMFLSNVQSKQKELSNNATEDKIFLASGSSDDQSDCLTKVLPLVAFDIAKNSPESISPQVLENIDKCVSVTQTGPKAVTTALTAARILFKCIKEDLTTAESATERFRRILMEVSQELLDDKRVYPTELDSDASQAIQEALSNSNRSHIEFVAENGKGCGLFFNFVNAMHAVLVHQGLIDSLTNTILAGGDCVARSNFIGAVFGTLSCSDDLPVEWKETYAHTTSLSQQISSLLSCSL